MTSEKLKDLVAFTLFYQNYLNDFEEQHSFELLNNVKKHFFGTIKFAKDEDHAEKCDKSQPCLRCIVNSLYTTADDIIKKFK